MSHHYTCAVWLQTGWRPIWRVIDMLALLPDYSDIYLSPPPTMFLWSSNCSYVTLLQCSRLYRLWQISCVLVFILSRWEVSLVKYWHGVLSIVNHAPCPCWPANATGGAHIPRTSLFMYLLQGHYHVFLDWYIEVNLRFVSLAVCLFHLSVYSPSGVPY